MMQKLFAPEVRQFDGDIPVAKSQVVYIAAVVDARIVELERELAVRKAAIEAQFRLMERVRELEEALGHLVDEQNGPPLIRRAEQWQSAVTKALQLLGRHTE